MIANYVRSSNLVAIAKCRKLRALDLSLILANLLFDEVKHAVRNLEYLRILRFPYQTAINLSTNSSDWPANLTTLQLNGSGINMLPEEFSWPGNLTSLTLHGCDYFSTPIISLLFRNTQLKEKLRRLRILTRAQLSPFGIMPDISKDICRLTFLSLPASDIVSAVMSEAPRMVFTLELEIIELAPSIEAPSPLVPLIKRALPKLPKLRRIGFHEMHDYLLEYDGFCEEIDLILKTNAVNAGYDKEKLESGEIATGCYIFS